MWQTQEIIVRGTPAQFAALVYHTSSQWQDSVDRMIDQLFLTIGRWLCNKGLFYVYDWPVPGNAPLVTVRINADGGPRIGQEERRRSTAYGWIDARSLPDLPGGETESLLVVELPPLADTDAMVIRHAWDILQQAMIEDGFVDEEDDEDEPAAVIGGGEGTAPAGDAARDDGPAVDHLGTREKKVKRVEELSKQSKTVLAIATDPDVLLGERTVVRIRAELAKAGRLKRRTD